MGTRTVIARRLALAAAVVALIVQCYGLYRPGGPPQDTDLPLDKIMHLLGFALPAGLFVLARIDWRIVGAVAVVQAIVSEVVQANLLPQRSGDGWDVVADLIGTALGCLGGWWLVRVSPGSTGQGEPDSGSPSR